MWLKWADIDLVQYLQVMHLQKALAKYVYREVHIM